MLSICWFAAQENIPPGNSIVAHQPSSIRWSYNIRQVSSSTESNISEYKKNQLRALHILPLTVTEIAKAGEYYQVQRSDRAAINLLPFPVERWPLSFVHYTDQSFASVHIILTSRM